MTRLIKASKNTKSTRDSFVGLSSIPTSLSQSSLSSSSSPHSHSQYHNPLSNIYNPLSTSTSSSNTKLTTAQAELQACETQLAAKERELEGMRISVVREGLRARCLAMVECGWSWGEMGKEGMRALEEMGGTGNGYGESLVWVYLCWVVGFWSCLWVCFMLRATTPYPCHSHFRARYLVLSCIDIGMDSNSRSSASAHTPIARSPHFDFAYPSSRSNVS